MDETLELAEKAAKNAKRALTLTALAVAVAIVVLAIDNGIKRAIVTEATRCRKLLDEARDLTEGVQRGTTAAGETRTDPGDSIDGRDAVVHHPAAGKILGQTPRGADAAPAKRPGRPPGRPPGDE